jgi:hypothetical protein
LLEPGLPESFYTQLSTGRGRVVFASCRTDESSYILSGAEYSLFTEHLLAGLRGGVPGPGGVVRIFDLFHYIQPKVTAASAVQHPIFKAEIEENFPIALYYGGKAAPLTPISTDRPNTETYDVFISYRQQEPDKSWVRKTLLPKLEEEGIRVCIDYRDFRLGAPLVTEMERAVEQSRYTLAILSPNYLESNFSELENVMSQHIGLEMTQYRLISLIRQACTPRLGIRSTLMLDVTEDDEFEINMSSLIYQLQQSPKRKL